MAGLTRYHLTNLKQWNGAAIDFDTDTLKAALLTVTYVPNAATDEFWANINANEVSGNGYTAGGEALASKSVVVDGGGDVTFDAADVTWIQGAVGFTNARILVLYKDTGVAATSPLIGFHDYGSSQENDNNTFINVWGANGILRIGDGTIT